MTIIRCPRCRDEVTVPSRATARALVRCPLCLEQYLLAEALANAPPPLVIIGGEVEQAAIEQAEETEPEYTVASGGFSAATFDSSPPATATVGLPRPTIRTGRRPRPKEKGGLVFFLSVVAGGLLAAPLAIVTLWWAFHVDRLDLGPSVARYAPWIVPAEFRGEPTPEITADQTVTDRPAQPRRDKAASRQFQTEPTPELQTLPGLDEPGGLPRQALKPSIDAPDVSPPKESERPQQKRSTTPKKSAQTEASALQTPPMPDLRDLLPD